MKRSTIMSLFVATWLFMIAVAIFPQSPIPGGGGNSGGVSGNGIFGNPPSPPTNALFGNWYNNGTGFAGFSITGKATNGNTSTEGVNIGLTVNTTNNRQLFFADTTKPFSSMGKGILFTLGSGSGSFCYGLLDGSMNNCTGDLLIGDPQTGQTSRYQGGTVIPTWKDNFYVSGPIIVITSGFGSMPSLESASNDVSGTVIIGSGGTANTGLLTFATAYNRAPSCWASDLTTAVWVQTVATTTTLTLNGISMTVGTAAAFGAADHVTYGCIAHG